MYLLLAFKPNSAVQRPEGLYREPKLMGAVLVCSALIAVLMVFDVPVLSRIFTPTAPTITGEPPRKVDLGVHGAGEAGETERVR
jgi:hypothetical protein